MSVFAVLWTFIAVVGLTVSVLNACDAYTVWNTGKHEQKLAQKLAFYQFRRSVMRTGALAAIALIGLMSLVPGTVGGQEFIVRASVVIAVLFLSASEIIERFEVMSLKKDAHKEEQRVEDAEEDAEE